MTHWLVTALRPNISGKSTPRGWRLHAIEAPRNATFTSIAAQPALCGLRARHGWDADLFITRRCPRCQRAVER